MKSNIIPMPLPPVSVVRDRLLEPSDITLHTGLHGLMECVLTSDDKVYHGVTAVLLFPISHPERFISLRYTNEEDKEHEIGIIGGLRTFPDEAVALVRASLARHYHEQCVHRVHRIKNEYGQLFFKVETQRGIEDFVMPWRQDRAEDYGTNGKVLLDALNNRYLIPDIDQLADKEKRLLLTYIYW